MMNDSTIYISLPQSTLVFSKTVHLEDIATVFCLDIDYAFTAKKLEIFTFSTNEEQQVISIMKIIELLSLKLKTNNIVNIGSPETIVYYQPKKSSKAATILKALFLIIVAFLGTGYSIMSYNGDVDTKSLLTNLFDMFTGSSPTENAFQFNLGLLFYSIGLCIGMIVFFNHGFNKRKKYDPTPLQVQMRLYEQDVNTAIIKDSERKGKTIDIN